MKRTCKADEMEMAINFQAMRIAYVFVEISLTAYCLYETVTTGALPGAVSILWLISVALFFAAKCILTKKVSGENGDEE